MSKQIKTRSSARRERTKELLSINLLIFLFSMCSLLLSFDKSPGMHWVKVLFVFLLGGFIGIAVMAALSVARIEEVKMNRYSASLSINDGEKGEEANCNSRDTQ
jgi:uncharacterized membrane protein